MLKIIFLLLVIMISKISSSQQNRLFYDLQNDNLDSSLLFNYQFYFFGDKHKNLNYSKAEKLIYSKLINFNDTNIFFIEAPTANNEKIKSLFYYIDYDSLNFKFSDFTKDNENINFWRNIYITNSNLDIEKRIQIEAIDFNKSNYNLKKVIINYYKFKGRTKIKNDLKILSKINSSDTNDYSNVYIKFYNALKINSNNHLKKLGNIQYQELNNILEGLKVFLECQKQNLNVYYQCDTREDYMLNNIDSKTKWKKNYKYISLNGYFHITQDIPEEWIGVKNWESLAYKLKKKYPNEKICSIYFLNRNDDVVSDKYFSYEKKIILENTIPGKYYLVKLDGENSPFNELSKKFQYIVVW